MYFSNFPKIYYDFAQDTTSDKLQILTDITSNVRFRKEVLDNITLYDEYDIHEGETPEIIAEKLYGNPELHWIIMLFNERYDYLKDFPLTNAELYEHCIETYGEDHLEDIHHYEINGIQVNAIATIEVGPEMFEAVEVNDKLTSLPNTVAMVTSKDVESSTVVLSMLSGRFTNGVEITLSGVRYSETLQRNVYLNLGTFNIVDDSFQINNNYDLVTNYEYELNVNEKKRRIKIVSPTIVGQIVSEFNKLIVT